MTCLNKTCYNIRHEWDCNIRIFAVPVLGWQLWSTSQEWIKPQSQHKTWPQNATASGDLSWAFARETDGKWWMAQNVVDQDRNEIPKQITGHFLRRRRLRLVASKRPDFQRTSATSISISWPMRQEEQTFFLWSLWPGHGSKHIAGRPAWTSAPKTVLLEKILQKKVQEWI